MEKNTESLKTLSQKPSQPSSGESTGQPIENVMWSDSDKESNKKNGVIILNENCNYSASKDKSLPVNSYIVKYTFNDSLRYDIVQSHSKVKIFDAYYDKIGNSINSIHWTDGRVNPSSYGYEPTKSDNKRRR